MPWMLLALLSLAPPQEAQEKIPIEIQYRRPGEKIDERNLAYVRSSVRRFVAPDEVGKVSVEIFWAYSAGAYMAFITLPVMDDGTVRLSRHIRLHPEGWSFRDPPPSGDAALRWRAERVFQVTRLFDVHGVTVDIRLHDGMTYDRTREVLRAIARKRISGADGKEYPLPALRKIMSIEPMPDGVRIKTRRSPDRGLVYECKFDGRRLTIEQFLAWVH